jgi:ATP-dependent Lon protease
MKRGHDQLKCDTDSDISENFDSDDYEEDSGRDDSSDFEEESDSENDCSNVHIGKKYLLLSHEAKRSGSTIVKKWKSVKRYLVGDIPTMKKILNLKITLEDKAELIEWYEILISINPISEEYIVIKNKIKQLIRQSKYNWASYNLLSADAHKNLDNAINAMKYENVSLPLKSKVHLLTADSNIKAILLRDLDKLSTMSNDEKFKLEEKVESAVKLPFNRITNLLTTKKKRTDLLTKMKTRLDAEFYGMTKVKEQLMTFINNRLQNPNMKQCCIGLVGPPGVGKTSLIKSLSLLMKLPFASISCGSICEIETLRGFSYTYVGSRPGAISNALTKLKSKNGIIHLDEFEKLANNNKLLPSLLEIIDPEQNCEYQDNYFEGMPMDLSKVWFIMSMNSLPTDSALRNRIYPIFVKGYNFDEKVKIVQLTISKFMKQMKLTNRDLNMNLESCKCVVRWFSKSDEKGCRGINNGIRDMLQKIKFLKDNSKIKVSFRLPKRKGPITITNEILATLCPLDQTNTGPSQMYI